jgi:CDP-diacylglycerol---glycerol-3-phosphate 3-phosphatidyltransferase
MGIYAIKPHFQKALQPIARWCVAHEITPTQLNLIGVVFAVGMAGIWWLALRWPMVLWTMPMLAFLRTAANALDGMVARETDAPYQAWGEVLNETLDRLSDIVIIGALVSVAPVRAWWLWMPLAALLLASYMGIIGKAVGGSRQYKGIMGKADRMVLVSIVAGLIAITDNWSWAHYGMIIMTIGLLITIIWRFTAIYHELTAQAYQ